MKPFGPSSNKSISNRKYGFNELTEIGNESEEAIVHTESKMDTKVNAMGTARR
jgi:hypothetical protein